MITKKTRIAPLSIFPLLVALLGAQASVGCTAAPMADDDASTNARPQPVTFGTDDRVAVTSHAYPFNTVGFLYNTEVNSGCTATIVGANLILTAHHCLGSSAGPTALAVPSSLEFYPSAAIGAGANSSSVFNSAGQTIVAKGTRYTAGVDQNHATGTENEDWVYVNVDVNLLAIPTVYTKNAAGALVSVGPLDYMDIGGLMPPTPLQWANIGYDQTYLQGQMNTQGPSASCRAESTEGTLNNTSRTSCDAEPGHSGGPFYTINPTTKRATVYAVMSSATDGGGAAHIHQDTYNTSVGNFTVNANAFGNVPVISKDVAANVTMAGGLQVFAPDGQWDVVSVRWKSGDANSTFANWQMFSPPWGHAQVRSSATNLTDGRGEIFFVDGSGSLTTTFQDANQGWGSLITVATPAPVLDVATSAGASTHVYVLTTAGAVYTMHKTGNASSPWSAWQYLGAIANAAANRHAIAATTFNGVHEVFVSTDAGVSTAYGTGTGELNSLVPFLTRNGGLSAIASGTSKNGLVNVFAVGASDGSVVQSVRSASGQWSVLASFTAAGPAAAGTRGSYTSLDVGSLADGREQIFAVADGEIFTTFETGAGWNYWIHF